jgi:arylsulfatase A-like enzyme
MESNPSDSVSQPNIVLIVIDALRKDHLGCYGHSRETSPFIDSLAAEGLVFERALSQAPWTAASMASIWTSQYPQDAGVGALEDDDGLRNLENDRVSRMRTEPTTLAEQLGHSGYRTIAITGNPFASSRYGLLRGFDEKIEHRVREPAEKVVSDGIDLLEKSQPTPNPRPFFLYLHFMDAHEPTKPPAPFDGLFQTLDQKPHRDRHYGWAYHRNKNKPQGPEFDVYRSHKLALYDGAIRYIDDQIERLVNHLETVGQKRETVFVIAADHGEEFWNHAEFGRQVSLDPRSIAGVGHGHTLFGELLDVPLILMGPGVPRGRVSTTVRNLDIAPTILGLSGSDPLDSNSRGIDLLAAIRSDALPHLDAVAQDIAYGHEARSIQDAEFKYIEYRRTRNDVLRFLFAAGEEDRNLLSAHPERAAALEQRLRDELGASIAGPRRDREAPELDPATREQLKELGYGS